MFRRFLKWHTIALFCLAVGALAWLIAGAFVLMEPPSPAEPTTVPETSIGVLSTPTSEPTNAPASPSLTVGPTDPPVTPTLALIVVVPSPTPGAVAALQPSSEAPAQMPVDVIVTATPLPSGNACPPPEGWTAYRVEPGDTLFGFQLGSDGKVDVQTIIKANCMKSNMLFVGQTIFLPAGVAEKGIKVDDTEPGDGGPRPANCPCMLRVREGWRLEQIAAAIDKLPAGLRGRDFLAATGPGAPVSGYWFLSSRPPGKSLEGFMFPGTYTIENGMTAAQLRDKMLEAFAANVGENLNGAAAARGLTFWQIVNLASIIQRESYNPEEQKMIASVIHNRMAAGKGIASFITLQYALGQPGNWWPRITSANINTDTPYNTSLYKGLPPSPIDNPGLSAIMAALYPAQTDYMYVSAKCGGGGSFYARTFEEFQKGLECDK